MTSSGKSESLLLTSGDLAQLAARGIPVEDVMNQIRCFEEGFPFARLDSPCTRGHGIESISSEDLPRLSALYEEERMKGRASVFVPASGAASRMFKSLVSVLSRDEALPEKTVSEIANSTDLKDCDVVEFFRSLSKFAFWGELREKVSAAGQDPDRLYSEGKYLPFLEGLLKASGLDYAERPKGLIPFHGTLAGCRTPFEDHLREACLYAADSKGRLRIHFTVSEEFLSDFRDLADQLTASGKISKVPPEICFSCQKASTDTLAVDMENRPFRDASGMLVFRPAGHGALLPNLEDLQGDLVFIKNIDNILVDDRRQRVIETQRMLGGFLVQEQRRIFGWLEKLDHSEPAPGILDEAGSYLEKTLGMKLPPEVKGKEKASIIKRALNRPLRVCGMVPNVGEPGGGPFWVSGKSGKSRQIVEKSQVDLEDPVQKHILESATHFNPVNLVCALRDFRGRPHALKYFVDPLTGFISVKSKDGHELKALELPGLWNGAMALWITFFVETPIETFGPVKQINDLLRPEHQGKD